MTTSEMGNVRKDKYNVKASLSLFLSLSYAFSQISNLKSKIAIQEKEKTEIGSSQLTQLLFAVCFSAQQLRQRQCPLFASECCGCGTPYLSAGWRALLACTSSVQKNKNKINSPQHYKLMRLYYFILPSVIRSPNISLLGIRTCKHCQNHSIQQENSR